MSTSTPSDNKTGPAIGVVIGLFIVGIIIIIVVVIVIGKIIQLLLNITFLLISSIGLSHCHVKEKIKQEK